MPGKAVGRAAVELPWLCPRTDSLVALADSPASVAALSAADPALCLFLLRFAQLAPEPSLFGFVPGALQSAFLPDTAAAFLGATSAGILPSPSFALSTVRTVTDRAAAIAGRLAEATRRATAETAAHTTRLAPLGWYAVAAVNHFDAADPLNDPDFPDRPAEVQTALWGLDQAAIARRLAARWRLPAWLTGAMGGLGHPFSVARRLVSHPDLFAIVQLALWESEKDGPTLGLTHGASREELLDHLGIDDSTVRRLTARESEAPCNALPSGLDSNPHREPLVLNLLRMAAESRRRNGPSLVARLEERIDHLHIALAEAGELGGERLQAAKLEALAELSAGAGHEINNPLAVISGNAQRLLRTEPDIDRGDALRAIIRQAHRIAGIIRDLMQFARPPRPSARAFPLSDLLVAVREELTPVALEREVGLELQGTYGGLWAEGDMAQLRHAVTAVVRNGIEAGGAGGWVRVSADGSDGETVTVVVEDSGPGLTPEAAEHAFDPFFSGRSAGRGRGLGLSTAWQLARQNGGQLRFDPADGEPTRFVLTLRKAISHEFLALRSA